MSPPCCTCCCRSGCSACVAGIVPTQSRCTRRRCSKCSKRLIPRALASGSCLGGLSGQLGVTSPGGGGSGAQHRCRDRGGDDDEGGADEVREVIPGVERLRVRFAARQQVVRALAGKGG